MICVSIGRGRHKHVLAEHKHLVEQGAQLVELRLDYINGEINLKRLLVGRPGPVVITLRRERDGGKWAGTEQERLMLLRSAIAEGVEYVDLEDDIAAQIPRYGKTKRIISLHDFRQTPDNLEAIHARLLALDADIVKIAAMANTPHDNVRMLRLVKNAKSPTVGMCMGDMGTPTRILASRFGSAFTYATFHHERALAPGQLSYRQMTDIYHYGQLNAETQVYGVIADPIGHSLSPVIHNAAFRQLGMNKVYVPFRVPREHLPKFLDDCAELGIRGLSVTIPHKETVVARLTKVDEAVAGIGAANTILFENGGLSGFNTDHRAAMDVLDEALSPSGASDFSLDGYTALVLGAGGVSKAVCYGLRKRGADVAIASRTLKRSEELADRLGCRAIEWNARHSVKADILVNGTPIGMHPDVDNTPYDKHYLRPSMVVFDTVYNPEQTLLLKQAREQSCPVVTGVEMFIRQAAVQFEHFTGQPAPVDRMLRELKKATGPAKL